jgi:hypothetical protein
MLKRTEELQARENLLFVVLAEQNLGDDSSDESVPEGHDDEHDITEHTSRYCITGRELIESSWNPYWESLKRADGRSVEAGRSSWLPGAAATSGNYETTILDGGAASSITVPPAASMSGNSTDGVRKLSNLLM